MSGSDVVHLRWVVDVDPDDSAKTRERIFATREDGSEFFPSRSEIAELAVQFCRKWQGACAAAEDLRDIAGLNAPRSSAAALDERFCCPDCGEGVAADEDGCCANCGADCVIEPSEEALRAESEALGKLP